MGTQTGSASGECSNIFPRADIEQSVGRRFEKVAARQGGRLAIKDGNSEVTFEELNQQANRVAQKVLELDGEGNRPIAVLMATSIPSAACMLGLLKAGKIYSVIDPQFPLPRIQFMIEDARAPIVIALAPHLALARKATADAKTVLDFDEIERGAPAPNPVRDVPPETLASLVYTSGSTGRPKGVVDTHRNVLYEAHERIHSLRITTADRLGSFHSFSFAAIFRSFFPVLLAGASANLWSLRDRGTAGLGEWMPREGITILSAGELVRQWRSEHATPGFTHKTRVVTMGGDTTYRRDVELCRRVFQPDLIMISYAGTEGGTVTRYPVAPDTPLTDELIPVGFPPQDKQVLILNEDGAPVASGEPGEIAVKSRFLAAGYWRRPELTAEKFLPAPDSPGARIYRTGDMGKIRPDGCLMHLGRVDFQVKIRGFRVETGEVVAALRGLPGVSDAVAVAHDGGDGQRELVAYLVSSVRHTVTALRARLGATLPEYMVPTRFVFVDVLPMTVTGKVDRLALPEPGGARPSLDAAYLAPRTRVEEMLAGIWAQVLRISPVGAHDNFLELGGHSLRAAGIISRVAGEFGVGLTLEEFFKAPTVAGMSLLIAQRLAEKASPQDVAHILDQLERSSG